jgi:hypothetical protein
VGKTEGNRPLGRPMRRREKILKQIFNKYYNEGGGAGFIWLRMMSGGRAVVSVEMKVRFSSNALNFLTS